MVGDGQIDSESETIQSEKDHVSNIRFREKFENSQLFNLSTPKTLNRNLNIDCRW